MEKEKSAAALLQEKLCYKPTQAAMKLSEEEIAQADRYCEDYKKFLDAAKTERCALRWRLPKRRVSAPSTGRRR